MDLLDIGLRSAYICITHNQITYSMSTTIFDYDRALNAFLYVANRVSRPDTHKIFKVLYFADMAHLLKYGRAITGDRYIAMKYGPVPSCVYDMVKSVSGKGLYKDPLLNAFFGVSGYMIEPLRDADKDYLSATDIEALDESIAQNNDYDFRTMTERSHGSAWSKAWDSPIDEISVEDMLEESGADKEYIDYIIDGINSEKAMC